MELLKQRINKDGDIKEGNIVKVDSFLNHQIDVELLNEIGKEFKSRFSLEKIDKILTIEASGIAIAVIVAQYFNVPVVFAKKTDSKNLDKDTYESKVYSYTKDKTYTIRVSKKYLNKGENILILDDFLAKGKAAEGLIDIINQSNSNLIGVGIVIEKGFQNGGKNLRDKGIKLESLAIVDSIENGKIIFR
ncbi:xanthine phosphoribosyltransferase [Tissierella pigra]|uniref:Xanthine phosphoribosyltransferase n=1 Tax=Tissierella pigra TaxID=2607614 RepID=A0A6N7XXS8_9FIRM|nr:xanthine phosphoribosyltransferase [Tissierella pigra]MBU5425475.1 xanthine phosphoribosyltransferase [Tissierella pigra]MSU01068.1 xanthine phosphoribosyltransferase [Tissierella pigra]